MDIEKVKEGFALIEQGSKILAGGPLDYYMRRLCNCYSFLLTFAPYKVGNRVQLTKTPEITQSVRWGWMGGKHFLVQGAQAVIVSVRSYGTGFDYGLVFDDDSWIESFTKRVHPRPESDRHEYSFTAEWFEALQLGKDDGR